MSNLTVDSHSRPAPIIDQQTGKLNSRFKHQAELVGLSFEGKSLAMVNEELQERCYQSDYEFYKQGNENPRFKISYDQAVQFLNDEYSDRSTEFPKDKQMGTCIFMGGALATVERRGYGLACAMRMGYEFDRLIAVSPHSESREAVDELVQPMCLAGTYESHTITHSSGTRTGDALELLSKLGIKGRVTLITDPAFVEKDRARAVQALGEDRFNGCVSVPMTDWRCEMRLHGYDEKSLGSAEKATIAWAQSAWNFKAREMNFEWKNFQAS